MVRSRYDDAVGEVRYDPITRAAVKTGIGEVESGRLGSSDIAPGGSSSSEFSTPTGDRGTQFTGFRNYGAENAVRREQALEFETENRKAENQRSAAKAKIDATQYTYEYSGEQEKQLHDFHASKGKIDEQVAAGEMLPQQAEDLKRQVDLQIMGLRPIKTRRGPTIQEQFESTLVDLPGGGKGIYNAEKRTMEAIPVGTDIPPKVYNEWYDSLEESLTTFDKEGNPTAPDPLNLEQAMIRKVQTYQKVMNAINGGGEQQQQAELAQQQLQQGDAAQQQPIQPTAFKMETVWDEGFAKLGFKASASELQELGQGLIVQAVESGMTADDAVKQLKKLWQKARRKKGVLRVANPSKFNATIDEKIIKEVAERKRLEVLEAKARQ